MNQLGTGAGVVTLDDGTLAAAPGSIQGATSRTAAKGEFLTIYCAGLGDVNNAPASGAVTPDDSSTTKSNVSVLLNGMTVPATFAGLRPGSVGLYQVIVQIPGNAPTGNGVTLALSVGGVTSNTVTVALQ